MVKLLIILLSVVTLASCSSIDKPRTFSPAALVGTWELKFDGNYPYWFSQIGFTQDGRKCVLSYEFDHLGRVSVDYYLNQYTIQNGNLVTEVTYSSSQYLDKGYIIKDRIDVLEPDYFEVFMIQPQGRVAEKHLRLADVEPEDICKVVSNFRNAHP